MISEGVWEEWVLCQIHGFGTQKEAFFVCKLHLPLKTSILQIWGHMGALRRSLLLNNPMYERIEAGVRVWSDEILVWCYMLAVYHYLGDLGGIYGSHKVMTSNNQHLLDLSRQSLHRSDFQIRHTIITHCHTQKCGKTPVGSMMNTVAEMIVYHLSSTWFWLWRI